MVTRDGGRTADSFAVSQQGENRPCEASHDGAGDSLKSIELLEDFNSRGTATKVRAGVNGGQAQPFAHSHGLMVVTGNCPTVGIAGGFTQGGGHSPLSSFLVEYEVVTSHGDLVTASPSQNEDPFWAFTGGCGGTYGVVYSMTIKAYPAVPVPVATLVVP